MITLGEENKPDEGPKPFVPPVPKIVPEQRVEPAARIVIAPYGYYVISYKLSAENNGKNRFAVTDHTNIEKFINEKLQFGERTYDVKIIEKVPDYLEALSIVDLLTIEENNGGMKKFRLGGILNAKYTWKELIKWDTPIKRFAV